MTDTSAALADGELAHAFQVQRRVLHALLMRELITRFGRHHLGALWLAGEPMLFTLGIMTLWTLAGMHHTPAIPIQAFAITGYSSVLLWRNAASHSLGAIRENKPLLFHRPVQVLDTLLVRAVVEVLGATGSFVLLTLAFYTFGVIPAPVDLSTVIEAWLLLAWFGCSLALVIGAGAALSPVIERLWQPTAYILFPLSGAAYLTAWLPAEFRRIVLWLPMVHGVEMLRAGYFGDAFVAHFDAGYLASCCLWLTLVGLALVRVVSRRISF